MWEAIVPLRIHWKGGTGDIRQIVKVFGGSLPQYQKFVARQEHDWDRGEVDGQREIG